MPRLRSSIASLAAVLFAIPFTRAVSQVAIPVPQPAISLSTNAEVKVSPDRATIRISVQTRATTAAAAGADNAAKQNSVLSALRKLGLSNEQLSTTDYNVTPTYRYEQNKEPAITGYEVTNTIVADIRDITMVGKVLDAALANGANVISSLNFYASNTAAARAKAITDAITKSRAEADVAARAAGGTIGSLLELSVSGEPSNEPRPVMMYSRGAAAKEDTSINPGQQSIIVNVSTRWSFVAMK
jgi:uncharacterized protein YggE